MLLPFLVCTLPYKRSKAKDVPRPSSWVLGWIRILGFRNRIFSHNLHIQSLVKNISRMEVTVVKNQRCEMLTSDQGCLGLRLFSWFPLYFILFYFFCTNFTLFCFRLFFDILPWFHAGFFLLFVTPESYSKCRPLNGNSWRPKTKCWKFGRPMSLIGPQLKCSSIEWKKYQESLHYFLKFLYPIIIFSTNITNDYLYDLWHLNILCGHSIGNHFGL